MRRPQTNLFAASLALIAFAAPVSARTLIHAGHLIDGKADSLRNAMTVIVEGDRIVDIVPGYSEPSADDTLIDLKDATVMPGLMDMHTHLSSELSKKSYLERFQLDEADYAFKAAAYAERTLMAGFTTVRDLGDRYNVSISLRNAVDQRLIKGPRIFTAAKSLATTGGHADPTNGMNSLLAGDPGPQDGVVNGPADAAKAVRQRYKDGADLIKITATGGVLSVAKSGLNPQFSDAELEAIVKTANDYDFHVAAHAHGAEGMKRAIRAGVHSIEHGTFLDAEAMALMKKAAAIGPEIKDTFANAYKAGVKIAFGTDSGVSAHGDNAQEFGLMVEGGMPAMEAIQAATARAAELLGVEDSLGSIEAGKTADLVAVPGNPLDDITLMESVTFVMKGGIVFKSD
jgi:imidazolonepropionase-like amidohydrolase